MANVYPYNKMLQLTTCAEKLKEALSLHREYSCKEMVESFSNGSSSLADTGQLEEIVKQAGNHCRGWNGNNPGQR